MFFSDAQVKQAYPMQPNKENRQHPWEKKIMNQHTPHFQSSILWGHIMTIKNFMKKKCEKISTVNSKRHFDQQLLIPQTTQPKVLTTRMARVIRPIRRIRSKRMLVKTLVVFSPDWRAVSLNKKTVFFQILSHQLKRTVMQ